MVLVINYVSFMTVPSVNRFELLLQEEVILAQEITTFDKKLESWSTAIVSKQPQPTARISGVLAQQQHKSDTDKTPSAVLAFEVNICRQCAWCISMDVDMFGQSLS